MAEAAPIKVLVVDDEPLAVERLQLLLARVEGVTLVGTANDGEGALRIAEAVAPDVVLLDIAMPGMDGIDVARALSESAARFRSIAARFRSPRPECPASRVRHNQAGERSETVRASERGCCLPAPWAQR